MRRVNVLHLLLAGAAVVVAAGLLATWGLSAWLSARGPQWLEARLEQALPVDVTIGAVDYHLLRGLQLRNVRVRDAASGETWLATEHLEVALRAWPIARWGHVAFRAHAALSAPITIDFFAAGRYAWRSQTLLLDVRTSPFPVDAIRDPLASLVPPGLKAGTLAPRVQLAYTPSAPGHLEVQFTGTGLVWEQHALRAEADVTLDGIARLPSAGSAWDAEGTLTLHRGALRGLPSVDRVTGLEGTATIQRDRLERIVLQGVALGDTWRLEGSLTVLPSPSIDVLLTSRVDAANLVSRFPHLAERWQASGLVPLRVACRGPLQPTPLLDCAVRADPQDVTLATADRRVELRQLSGTLLYDVLAQRLTISQLTGRARDHTLTIGGELTIAPLAASLIVHGGLPLEFLAPWLPPSGAVRDIGGLAVLDLELHGPLAAPRVIGEAALRDGHLRVSGFPHEIRDVTGDVRLSARQIEVQALQLSVAGRPATIEAIATRDRPSRVTATVRLESGTATVAADVTPEAIRLHDARLTLERSDLRVTGLIRRGANEPSALAARGEVDLAEIGRLPWLPLPAFAAWEPSGRAQLDMVFDGPLTNWRRATLTGRLTAEALQVRRIPLEQLTCTVEQREGVLRIQWPSAVLAGGSLRGGLTIEPAPDGGRYRLEANVVDGQIERLREAVPAWRTREARGTVSAQLELSGLWPQRATWSGSGWLNAAGEGLGDVPLLDRVLGGLFGVLGDRLGLEPLRRAKIRDVWLNWRLEQERILTDDFRLGAVAGIEPVAVYAQGSVGLDQTLDFIIEPELSEASIQEAPTTSTLVTTVLKAAGQLQRFRRLVGRHRLTGTLKEPEFRFEFTLQELFKQSGPSPAGVLQGLFDSLRSR